MVLIGGLEEHSRPMPWGKCSEEPDATDWIRRALVIGDAWRTRPAALPFQWTAAHGWCSRCQRAYPAIVWVENGWGWPNRGCEGTFDDAWEWKPGGLLLAGHPEFPDVPERAERYPA